MHLECLTPAALTVLKMIAPVVTTHGFVLAGGTAVALRLGHRVSVDFDFFTERSFVPAKILQAVNGLGLTATVLQEEPGTLTVSVNGVKISFFHYPYAFLEATSTLRGVPVAGLIDIASMKIIAMIQRGAKRDYVDLYFILQDIPFAKVAENMIHRYGVDRVNPVVIGKALVFFQDADLDPEPAYLVKRKDWSAIKKYIANHIQQFALDIHNARRRD